MRCITVTVLLSGMLICWGFGAQALSLTSGNLLVTHASRIAEYTPSGVLVQEIPGPFSGTMRGAVVTEGYLHIFTEPDGNLRMALSSIELNGTGGWVTNRLDDKHTLAGVLYYGGISADNRYVYTPDTDNGGSDLEGIVRFDLNDLSIVERIVNEGDPHVTRFGLDGNLYLMGRSGNVQRYDPLTLAKLGEVGVRNGASVESFAVDRDGTIFTVDLNQVVNMFQADGTLLKTVDPKLTQPRYVEPATDIQIAPDGTIIIGGTGGSVTVTDRTLSSFSSFEVPVQRTSGFNEVFVTFTDPVPEPTSMSLIGLGLIACLMRRHRVSAS